MTTIGSAVGHTGSGIRCLKNKGQLVLHQPAAMSSTAFHGVRVCSLGQCVGQQIQVAVLLVSLTMASGINYGFAVFKLTNIHL